MKNLNLFSACVLIAQVFFITAAYSQITITSSDYQKNLNITIKTVGYGSSDTSGLRSVVSASGANKTWNLTGRTFTRSDTTTSTLLNKSSSGAPQQDNPAFSSATLVVQQRTSSKPLFTNWSYESLTTTGLFYYGYVQDSAGIVKANQTNDPSWRSQTYPTTYLTAWSWASTVTATTYRPSGNVSVVLNMSGNDVVDAYGTVTTPEGSFPCLRIKRKFNIFFGFFTITTYSYEFIDQNRTYARIDADETGNVPNSVSYCRQLSVTGLSETPNLVPSDFQLSQNYPNPFNPTTTIKFYIPKTTHVILKIFDVLGREVAVLVNDQLNAGDYKVKWNAKELSSGIYLYRLQAGEFIETKKLTLLR